MRGKKYNRGGQGSKGYGKTNKQDAMEQAMDIKMEMDKPKDIKMKKPDRPKGIIIEFVEEGRNMGGTMKNYRAGGIEAADKEGSRLSISMERQEDAGYSPSEADFDKQHTLAAEGIMEVGADVTTIQGHNSRASLGETEGVRGKGAMIRGTKFVGVL
jgi:hypothetical protein